MKKFNIELNRCESGLLRYYLKTNNIKYDVSQISCKYSYFQIWLTEEQYKELDSILQY